MSGIKLQAEIKKFDAEVIQAKANAEMSIEEMKAVQAGYVALSELKVKAIEGSANIAAQLCASAMTAVNASATCSDSESYSKSDSTSLSTSFNYNY